MCEKRKPSSKWYLLPVIVFLFGLVSYIILYVYVVIHTDKQTIRIDVPTKETINLIKVGKYYINYEYLSDYNNTYRETPSDQFRQLDITIENNEHNNVALMSMGSATYQYTSGLNKGFAIFTFVTETSGTYFLDVKYKDGKDIPRLVLSIEPSPLKWVFFPMLFLMIYFIIFLFLSVFIFLALYRKRNQGQLPDLVYKLSKAKNKWLRRLFLKNETE